MRPYRPADNGGIAGFSWPRPWQFAALPPIIFPWPRSLLRCGNVGIVARPSARLEGLHDDAVAEPAVAEPAVAKKTKPSTAHLKVVPETRDLRDQVRAAVAEFGKTLDRSKPLTKPVLQAMAEELLQPMGLGEQYLGFTMVCHQPTSSGASRSAPSTSSAGCCCCRTASRTPRAARPTTTSSASIAASAGPARVADFKTKAEDLGYKVLVSEGTPIVLKIIVRGHVDAIVGVACLNVLEKAIDKILLAGIPCVAAPLLVEQLPQHVGR